MNKINAKGFTLIELLIGVAILAILAAIFIPFLMGKSSNSNVSWGYNGVVETRCIEGYKYMVTQGGKYEGTGIIQVKDEHGNGVKCR